MNPAAEAPRHLEAYGSTLLSRLLAAAATLSLHVMIARQLGPAEYAAAALLVTIIAILLLVLSFGNEPLLVREGGALSSRARSVAFFSPLLALLLAAVILFLAPAFEEMFDVPGLARLLQWGIPVLPLQLMQVVPRAELLRRQEFRFLARTDATSSIMAWLPAAALFVFAADIIAFALYLWVMHVVRLVLYLRRSAIWRGVMDGQRRSVMLYLRSWRIFSIDTCTFLTTTFDDLMVGANLGAAMLGVYHLCYRIIVIVQEFFAGVMRVLGYPRYTFAAPDRDEVYRLFCADTRFVNSFVLPSLTAVLLGSDALLAVVLGEQWEGARLVMQLLVLEAMRQSLLAMGGQAMLALGDERALLRYSLLSAMVLLPLFVLLSLTDLRIFVIGFVAVNTLLNMYFFVLVKKSFARRVLPLLVSLLPGISGSLFVALSLVFIQAIADPSAIVFLCVAACVLSGTLALMTLASPDIKHAFRSALGIVRARRIRRGTHGTHVYTDGPFDETNPHLKRIYAFIEEQTDGIIIHPLHLRQCLKDRLHINGVDHPLCRIIHLHYPQFLYDGGSFAASVIRGLRAATLLLLLKALGYRFVITLHDRGAHDFPFRAWERFYLTALIHAADRVTTLSDAGRDLLFNDFGYTGRIVVARHCVYDVPVFSLQRRSEKRVELGISPEETAFLLFGLVKPYKGYTDFIRECADMHGIAMTLICAGAGMQQETLGISREGLRIIVLDRFIDTDETAALMDAADFGALPYRRILHSGTAMLFASQGCPVIAPRLGVFTDHEKDHHIGLYYTPDNRADLRRVILDAVRVGREEFADGFSAFQRSHRLEDEAAALLALYRELSGEKMATQPSVAFQE